MNKKNKLEEGLTNIEVLRTLMVEQLKEIEWTEGFEPENKLSNFNKIDIEPNNINGYRIYQFSYDGMLPHYNDKNYKYIKAIRNYYYMLTVDKHKFIEDEDRIEDAVIIYVQYFKDDIIRDLDNRNSKYILDAIKRTGIMVDDSWKHLWETNLGFKDKVRNHVQVYVVERSNFQDFFGYLLKNHETLKNTEGFYLTKNEFVDSFEDENEKVNIEANVDELF